MHFASSAAPNPHPLCSILPSRTPSAMDIDHQLQQLFDDDDHEEQQPSLQQPCTPPPQDQQQNRNLVIPESPDRCKLPASADDNRPKSILDALVAQNETNRLTSHASSIANQVKQALIPQQPTEDETTKRLTNSLGRKRPASNILPSNVQAEHSKRIRNTFHVIAKKTSLAPSSSTNNSNHTKTYEINQSNISNMPLRHSPFQLHSLEALFEHCKRIDLSELADTAKIDDLRCNKIKGEWITFGTIVKKHGKRETKDGSSKFCVWSLCNMPRWNTKEHKQTMINLLLFDQAFQSYHMLTEGTAIALRKPVILPPKSLSSSDNVDNGCGIEWSGYCLKITKPNQMINIGINSNFKVCTQTNGKNNAENCSNWYDSNRMTMCSFHLKKKMKSLTTGHRMDVNNAERPVTKHVDRHKINNSHNNPIEIKNISRVDHFSNGDKNHADGYDDLIQQERKRKADEDLLKANALRAKHGLGSNGKNLISGRSFRSGSGSMTLAAAKLQSERAVRAQKSNNVIRNGLEHQHLQRPHHVAHSKSQSSRGAEMFRKVVKERQEKRVMTKEEMQNKYDSAIQVLLRVGYQVTVDGDLVAPPASEHSKYIVKIQKGQAKSIGNKTEHVCLSDESDDG